MAQVFIKKKYNVLINPLLTIEIFNEPIKVKKYDAILTTSMQALYFLGKTKVSLDVPLYVVGESSFKVAKNYGFNNIYQGQNQALSLLNIINHKTLLYLRGDVIHQDLKGLLKNYNIKEQIVYKSVPASNFTLDVLRAFKEKRVHGVLVYSTRTAGIFLELCRKNHLSSKNIVAFCLSESIVQALEKFKGTTQIVSPPSSIVKTVENFFKSFL